MTPPRSPGWKATEHWLVVALILLAGALAWHGLHGGDVLRALAGPSVVASVYAAGRTLLKSLPTLAAKEAHMDIDATIDAFVKKFVASKIPASANLQPECDAAIVAAEALAHKALEVYAVKLLAKKAPQLVSALQAAFPGAGL